MTREKEASTKEVKTSRPPIVAILGHIDHGKSTLLDYIRKTNVVEKEAGRITQHVHAYKITHKTESTAPREITFIDTPGHAAFATSRSRGAHIADIAILLISAEEGVKEQTKESIRIILESKTPFVVAINKIDRPNANPDRVKQELAEAEIFVEGYGGTVPCVLISAKTGEGITELLDIILLLSELEELSANINIPATGFVLDSHVDTKKGITGVCIVKDGMVRENMFFVCGNKVSKIKRISSFEGKVLEEAFPSDPVIIGGLSEIPTPGTSFYTFTDKKGAEEFAREQENTLPANGSFSSSPSENENECATLALVTKTDVIGTLDGILHELKDIKHPRAQIKILRAGVGTITEDDVALARAAKNSFVLGFHVPTDKAALDYAREAQIPIHLFDIIYKLTEFVEKELVECAPTAHIETVEGHAKIIRVFNPVRGLQIIGARVVDGVVKKDAEIDMRIVRDEEIRGKGTIEEMQIERVPVKRAEKNDQFGASIKTNVTLALGDELVFYTTREE